MLFHTQLMIFKEYLNFSPRWESKGWSQAKVRMQKGEKMEKNHFKFKRILLPKGKYLLKIPPEGETAYLSCRHQYQGIGAITALSIQKERNAVSGWVKVTGLQVDRT